MITGARSEVTGRVHFLDTARAVAMLLGVPLHAAYAYQSGEAWLVTSPNRSPVFYYFISFVHAFRMHAFFMIAGILAAMLVVHKSNWLMTRFERLGVPLIGSLATIMAFQFGIFANFYPETIVRFTSSHRLGQLYVSHLWFLLSLIAYSTVLSLVVRWRGLEWNDSTERTFLKSPFWWAVSALTAAIVYEIIIKAAFQTGPARAFLDATQGTLPIEKTLYYAPYFFFGVILQRRRALFDALTAWRKYFATGCLIAVLMVAILPPGGGQVRAVLRLVMSVPAGFAGAYLLLALARKVADRPDAWVQALVGSSFTIFLFHHPLVIAGDLMLLDVDLPPWIEVGLVTAFALFVAWSAHFIIRRSTWLHWLFNGVPRHRTSPSSKPALATDR